MPQISRFEIFDASLAELKADAEGQGFRFVHRLEEDWFNGTNRFCGQGELLLGAFKDDRLVAVGGLNQEPYDPRPRRGRLRHLYVLSSFRRQGIGSALVRQLLEMAAADFDEIRLRTDSREAAAFYESIGFVPLAIASATYGLRLAL